MVLASAPNILTTGLVSRMCVYSGDTDMKCIMQVANSPAMPLKAATPQPQPLKAAPAPAPAPSSSQEQSVDFSSFFKGALDSPASLPKVRHP